MCKYLLCILLVVGSVAAEDRMYWSQYGEEINELFVGYGCEITVQVGTTCADAFPCSIYIGNVDNINACGADPNDPLEPAMVTDIVRITPDPDGEGSFTVSQHVNYWRLFLVGLIRGPGELVDITITGHCEGTELLTCDMYNCFDAGDPNLIVTVGSPHTLTILTEPNFISTTIPPPGQYQTGGWVNITANPYPDCPAVKYGIWMGDVEDPNSASTRVYVDSDKTITAVFAEGRRVCGDLCHPILRGDMNEDCYINFADFRIFCSRWLACTHPDCD